MADQDQSQMFDALQAGQTTDPDLKIVIQSAEIKEDHELFGKMDIYVKFDIKDEEYQTTTAEDQGQKPSWDQTFDIFRGGQNLIVFEIWEEDSASDDKLGYVEVDVNKQLKLQNPGEVIEISNNIKNKEGVFIGILKFSLQELLTEAQKQDKQQQQSTTVAQNLEIKRTVFTQSVNTEALQRKVSEIQKRLDSISVNLSVEPSTQYNQDNVHRVLVEGLNKIGKERPANPIRELGLFLMNYKTNQ